jgi:hypothetical protein
LRSVALGLAALALVAGCGGGSLSSAQRSRLEGELANARKAAAAHNPAGVAHALAVFRASVRSARADGAISREDAGRLIAQALTASRRAGAEITPTPTPAATPVATPAATIAPAAPAPQPAQPPGKAKKDKPGKPGKPGKGHGHR